MEQINSLLIKQKAIQLGFDACGIAKIKLLTEEGNHIKSWLNKGFQGDMQYIERGLEKRIDASKILPNAKSIIVLIKNYSPKNIQSKDTYQIAKYAYGKDYHLVFKPMLTELEEFIKQHDSNITTQSYTDSGSVLEKRWAVEAGLGWTGKQSLFISPEFGSYCLIAEIITDIELDYDKPYTQNHCGSCVACMHACPTNAITEPHIVNATRCIAYLSIESKREIPDELKHSFNNQIFGCDICQDVCPYNKKPITNTSTDFQLSQPIASLTCNNWKSMTEEKFNELFKNSPLKRSGLKGIQRLFY